MSSNGGGGSNLLDMGLMVAAGVAAPELAPVLMEGGAAGLGLGATAATGITGAALSGAVAAATGQNLDLSVGYSHNIIIQLPKEIKVSAVTEKGSNPIVTMESFDKELLGAMAAKIRSFRKPEPYKGKGIKFVGEQLRRKAGKTAGK